MGLRSRLVFAFSVLVVPFALLQSSATYAGSSGDGLLHGLVDGLKAYADALEEEARNQAELERQLQHERRRIEQRQELEELQRQRILRQQEQERQAAVLKQREAAEQERRRAQEEKRNAMLTGSGFFVTDDGYIVTNAHVVGEKSYFAVRDMQGRFYRAEVKSIDNSRDLALLQISGYFPVLRISSSGLVKKGDRVLTVGYPQPSIQGSESKVTDGIVNSLSGLQNDERWFQVSVPIQGGNSGGPLVNERGEVVGVVGAYPEFCVLRHSMATERSQDDSEAKQIDPQDGAASSV